MIQEEWQADIVARDNLDAKCLVSFIANLLYPDLVMAKDREAKLFAEGGAIIQRIAAAAKSMHELKEAELLEWRAKA